MATLSVKDGIGNREWAASRVQPGGWLEIGYTHSMYGARQTETFLIDPDLAFRLEKVLFGSLAAALYYESDPPSGIAVQDHAWRISGEGKRYRVLRYRVSLETGHTLKFGDRTVDLSDLAEGADGLVLIEVEKRSRLASLFIAVRKKILHFFGKQNCVA